MNIPLYLKLLIWKVDSSHCGTTSLKKKNNQFKKNVILRNTKCMYCITCTDVDDNTTSSIDNYVKNTELHLSQLHAYVDTCSTAVYQ